VICRRVQERLGGLSPQAVVEQVEVRETPQFSVIYRP
jgi:hypothetical protein